MIRVSDLRKSYKEKHALRGITFEVREGEFLAFWDPMAPARRRRSRF